MSRIIATLILGLIVSLGLSPTIAAACPDGAAPQVGGAVVGVVGGQVPTGRPGQVPPRDATQQSKPGTAVVRGRVLAGDTGQPLRKVQIRIISQSPPVQGGLPVMENRMATTDASGAYEFKELPAGRYQLTATKGSYVSLQYGQLRPLEPGKPIDILDGQLVEKVDFTLPRGAVITGRILDEFGEPITDVQVSAQRYQYMSNGRRLVSSGRSVATNDIGEFRLFALPPGDYYLSATLRSNVVGDTTDRSGYAPTYYPGTADVATAQKLSVGIGQTMYDLTMALLPTRTARVTGTAVDSEGRALTGMLLVIQSSGGGFNATSANQVRPDGSFTLSALTPGEYTLQVQPMGITSIGIGANASGESASATITVSGADITGLRLVGTKPRAVTGRVIVDPATVQALKPSSLRVMAGAMPVGGLVLPSMSVEPKVVNDDWTFQALARPGMTRVNLVGTPGGWSVKAVRYRGVDVIDTGLEVRAYEDVSDVEIELTNKVTDVSGAVTNSRGEPAKDYALVVFASDRQKWPGPTRYTRTARPDQNGRFKVNGLPPGDYLAVAVEYIEPGSWGDPDILERLRPKAASFSLREGETKAIDLRLSQ